MNKRVKFLLDSGAVLSVIIEKLATTLKLPALKKTDHKLIGATGHDLKVLGVAKKRFNKTRRTPASSRLHSS